jgi:hypothetical protein
MNSRRTPSTKLLLPAAVLALGALVAACGSNAKAASVKVPAASSTTAATAGAATSSPTTLDLAAAKKAAEKSIASGGGGGDDGQGGDGNGDGGGRGGLGPFGDALDVAAKDLGMTAAELQTATQGGQTMAQLAQAKGVDVNKLIDDMVAGVKQHFDADVASGEHTQAEADQMLSQAKAQVTDMVNGKTPVGGPPGGGRAPQGSTTTVA